MLGRRLLLWGFKPPREANGALGSLERRVMDVVWARGTVSVREARADMGSTAAYTTVMTTLDRLYKKGLLERRREGRAYLYSASASRDEIERSVAADLLEGMLTGGRETAEPVLSSLVDAVGESDRGLLEELDRLVREKRRQLRRRGPR